MNATSCKNSKNSKNSMKRRLALVVLSVAAGVLVAGCGSLTSYAAKVNGQRITQNELDRELNAILGNKAYLEQVDQGSGQARGAGRDTLSTVFVARVLERRIAFELIHQEVRKKKLEVTPKDLEDARAEILASIDNDDKILSAFPESYREELVRSTAEVAVLERSFTETPKDDAAVKAFYEANAASFETFCLRGILVTERPQADSIKSRVSAGADFAAIAKAESKDNQGADGGSAAKGGELGCIPRSSLGEFGAAVGGLQPGQVSEPLQTPPGFLLFQVTERKAKSLPEAAPEIRQRLEQQSTEGLRGFVNDAMMKAKVTLNPRYGEFVQSGPEIGIKPPTELTSTTLAPDVAP
ncbi:MAG: peptidyl-prolyl cis-trans isomerase [Actinomycetota bacterium]|nr:peptidyl-prolyl cis-trans isomerase [Actinomycetota bacterium]MDQ3680083.1 peptidyl-prolyl cis-trans isomerase [Actinomycetota bacterium]